MNKKAFAALSDVQRDALRVAARHAVPATIAYDRKEEREATAILCRRKPTLLKASDSDLAALRRAVRPVYDSLERDTVTKHNGRSARCDGRALDHRGAEVLQRGIDDDSCGQGHANRRRLSHDDDAEGRTAETLSSEDPGGKLSEKATVAGGSCLIGGGSTTRSPAQGKSRWTEGRLPTVMGHNGDLAD